MRVLLLHNSYRQRGGEDAVFEAERDLLAANGHEVIEYHPHNDATSGIGPIGLAARTVWSRDARREIAALCRSARPDVAHFHNTLPLISPSGYRAAHAAGVPVVQTLHNYRMVCPSALLYRDGAVCEDCVGRATPWPAVRHGCYRGSRAASAAVAAMLTTHRALGTYRRRVDAWIALTEFQRRLVVRGGVPAERAAVVPNFLAVDPPAPATGAAREGVLFVGRLTAEKGIRVVLDAARRLPDAARVRILGDGPLRPEVDAAAARDPRIEALGARSAAEVDAEMRGAAVLVVPSLWYEGLPMTVVEAYARGLPVVASDLGGLAEVVEDGRTGLRVAPGDAAALAAAVVGLTADRPRLDSMASAARAMFESRYTAAAHLDGLLMVYDAARRARRDGGVPRFEAQAGSVPRVAGIRPDPRATGATDAASMLACRPIDRPTAVHPPGS